MHHLPVKGAGFPDDDKIRVDVGNGKAGFVQLVDQRPFTHHIGFLTFLAAQKIGRRHRRGVEGAIRNLNPGGGETVRQILAGLRRVVGQHHQRHAFLEDALDKLGSAGNGDVIVHQHTVNITNYVLNGHGGSRIIIKDETIRVIDEVSHL